MRERLNSFSPELNFEVCIIVLIACFKKKISCFCYSELNFISINPQDKFSKIFVQSFVNDTYAALDV